MILITARTIVREKNEIFNQQCYTTQRLTSGNTDVRKPIFLALLHNSNFSLKFFL